MNINSVKASWIEGKLEDKADLHLDALRFRLNDLVGIEGFTVSGVRDTTREDGRLWIYVRHGDLIARAEIDPSIADVLGNPEMKNPVRRWLQDAVMAGVAELVRRRMNGRIDREGVIGSY